MIEFFPFAEGLLGFYFVEPPLPPAIGLHRSLAANEPLLRCVLAEELGHHFTSAGDQVAKPYRTHLGRVLLTRTEKRAMAWAAGVLMPREFLPRVLGQASSVQAVAEAYLVTPAFVRAALGLPQYRVTIGSSVAAG